MSVPCSLRSRRARVGAHEVDRGDGAGDGEVVVLCGRSRGSVTRRSGPLIDREAERRRTVVVPSSAKTAAISLLHPSMRTERLEHAHPAMMKGLRRPSELLQRSERTPTRGWTMRPDRGPARKTMLIMDFETPSERRKGDAARSGGEASARNGAPVGTVSGLHERQARSSRDGREEAETHPEPSRRTTRALDRERRGEGCQCGRVAGSLAWGDRCREGR